MSTPITEERIAELRKVAEAAVGRRAILTGMSPTAVLALLDDIARLKAAEQSRIALISDQSRRLDNWQLEAADKAEEARQALARATSAEAERDALAKRIVFDLEPRAIAAEQREAAALSQRDELAKALEPFAAIRPSSFYPADGSEGEKYCVLLKDNFTGNPTDFTGTDLARARRAAEALARATAPPAPASGGRALKLTKAEYGTLEFVATEPSACLCQLGRVGLALVKKKLLEVPMRGGHGCTHQAFLTPAGRAALAPNSQEKTHG